MHLTLLRRFVVVTQEAEGGAKYICEVRVVWELALDKVVLASQGDTELNSKRNET